MDTFNIWDHLVLAKLPSNNPHSKEELLSHSRYAITLVEHDYAGKTAAMWNAAYEHFKMDVQMAMMIGKPEEARIILASLRKEERYIGGGAGVGFKDENIPYLDDLDPLARAIGSSNLIQKLPSGELMGWNTDGLGYRQSLEEVLAARGKYLAGSKILMLGAGGTGNAVAFALAEKGALITILNRTAQKAADLALRINSFMHNNNVEAKGEDALLDEVADADVIINVSTKGATGDFENYSALAPAKLPANPENINENLRIADEMFSRVPSSTIISDVVLRETPSPFLKRADELGFTTLDGIPMVINQGVEAFLIIHEEKLRKFKNVRKELEAVMRKAAHF